MKFDDEYDNSKSLRQPGAITLEQTQNILNQMKNSICKIFVEEGRGFGTGFFCRIPFPDSLNFLPVLITCHHILGEKDILNGQKIIFTLNDDKITYSILINNERKTYTNEMYNITIIEILKKDGLDSKSFLDLDIGITSDKVENKYIKEEVYLIGYNKENMLYSLGLIRTIQDKYRIIHSCSSGPGTSGSPILNLKNYRVIGVHIGANTKNRFNIALLIIEAINDFNNSIKGKNKLNNIIEDKKEYSEIIRLRKEYENSINEINKLKKELEKERLKNEELAKRNEELEKLIKISNLNKGDKSINNNITELLQEIKLKNEEISQLKELKSRYPFELLNGEKLISVIFTSIDQKIHYSIICKNTDIFSKIEKELYDEYPEYGEEENYFMANGKKIIKHKTLDYNKIHNSDIITLKKMCDDL